MKQIYEHMAPDGSPTLNKLWRYRTKIDTDHLAHTLDQTVSDPNKYPVLREFLRKVSQYLSNFICDDRQLIYTSRSLSFAFCSDCLLFWSSMTY